MIPIALFLVKVHSGWNLSLGQRNIEANSSLSYMFPSDFPYLSCVFLCSSSVRDLLCCHCQLVTRSSSWSSPTSDPPVYSSLWLTNPYGRPHCTGKSLYCILSLVFPHPHIVVTFSSSASQPARHSCSTLPRNAPIIFVHLTRQNDLLSSHGDSTPQRFQYANNRQDRATLM